MLDDTMADITRIVGASSLFRAQVLLRTEIQHKCGACGVLTTEQEQRCQITLNAPARTSFVELLQANSFPQSIVPEERQQQCSNCGRDVTVQSVEQTRPVGNSLVFHFSALEPLCPDLPGVCEIAGVGVFELDAIVYFVQKPAHFVVLVRDRVGHVPGMRGWSLYNDASLVVDAQPSSKHGIPSIAVYRRPETLVE